jgi:tetratricopeptide (TPR) repeat protein
MQLHELLDALSKDETNAKLHIEIAEAYHKLGKIKETEYHLKKALELDDSDLPYFQIFDENFQPGKTVTFIIPKPGTYSQRMHLDGFTFYSYLLHSLLDHLLSVKKRHLVLSLNNVEVFSDLGLVIVLQAQARAQQLKGDLKCINGNAYILDASKMIGKDDYPEIFLSVQEAINSFNFL